MSTRYAAAMVLALLILMGAADGRVRGGHFPSEGMVKHVLDGDTIVLETGENVRYLGIDAPELRHDGKPSECWARKAQNANSEMVLGKRVELRFSPQTRDRFGRLLAYVFTSDGTCVNVEMVRSGNAWIYGARENPEMFSELLTAQKSALDLRRGLWKACYVKPEKVYHGNRDSSVFHRPRCPLGREMSERSKVPFTTRREAFAEGFSPCRNCRP